MFDVQAIFDGYGIVLEDEEAISILEAKFGELDGQNPMDTIDNQCPSEFNIYPLSGSWLFGQTYSSMNSNLTKVDFEVQLTLALEAFFKESGIKVKPRGYQFCFGGDYGEVREV